MIQVVGLRWFSWLFNYVEHTKLEVAYACPGVLFDDFIVVSDDGLCLLAAIFFKEFHFSIGRFLAFFLGSLSEQGSHVKHLFQVECIRLFSPVELGSVMSSDVEVGE